MRDEIDALIDEAAVYGEVTGGTPLGWLAQRYDARLVAVVGAQTAQRTHRRARWIQAEKELVIGQQEMLTDEQIAAEMGRSGDGVKIYRQRHLKLKGVTKHPDWLTAHQVRLLLGFGDVDSAIRLVERGILPARLAPLPVRKVYQVRRSVLVAWVLRPENWIYFRPHLVREAKLRRLIALRQARWGDAWWTPGQVAAYHGVISNDVNRYIRAGKLAAVRWGNWWVLRSEATKPGLTFPKGKGSAHLLAWSQAGDAFMLLAKAVGLSAPDVGRLCGVDLKRVHFRYVALRKKGRIDAVIADGRMAMQYNPATGQVFADWRQHQDRFPAVVRAVDRLHQGRMTKDDIRLVVGVLARWAGWYAQTAAQRDRAEQLAFLTVRTRQGVERVYGEIRAWGIDPLG